jgi:hypothetical protein
VCGFDACHDIAHTTPIVPVIHQSYIARTLPLQTVPDDITCAEHSYLKPLRNFFTGGKLAHPKESAKRFFGLITSTHRTSDSQTAAVSPTTPTSPACAGSVRSSAGTMFGGGDGRAGHDRSGSVVGGPISGMVHRPSLADNVRTAAAASGNFVSGGTGNVSSPIGDEKPLASGNGVAVSIALAEPVLFLQGFDTHDVTIRTTTMLRGSLHLKITKPAKIKKISINFRGRAETEWPEGESRLVF